MVQHLRPHVVRKYFTGLTLASVPGLLHLSTAQTGANICILVVRPFRKLGHLVVPGNGYLDSAQAACSITGRTRRVHSWTPIVRWDGTKSSITAFRIRSGGSNPWARMKSWNFF